MSAVTATRLRSPALSRQPLDFIYSPGLDCWDNREDEILAPMPDLARYLEQRRNCHLPKNLIPEIANAYLYPLLTKPQEVHLFRRMNYCKGQYNMMLDVEQHHPARRLDQTFCRRMAQAFGQVMADQELLVESNTRLVINLIKKRARDPQMFFELLSDGNMSLLRAVTKFDYARGFKFSTYGSWAIIKNCCRTISDMIEYEQHFRTGGGSDLLEAIEDRSEQPDPDRGATLDFVYRCLGLLEPREREVVKFRIGMYGPSPTGRDNWTMEQVGRRFGITKERVRQLYNRAIRKMAESA